MMNPFDEKEVAEWEKQEKEKRRYEKRFMREAHYHRQALFCCQSCAYGECNEDYSVCRFGNITIDIDWDGRCDHFVCKTNKQEESK